VVLRADKEDGEKSKRHAGTRFYKSNIVQASVLSVKKEPERIALELC